MYVNFLSTYSDKSPAIPKQLYKPASRGLSAIAELLVLAHPVDSASSVMSALTLTLSNKSRLAYLHAGDCEDHFQVGAFVVEN